MIGEHKIQDITAFAAIFYTLKAILFVRNFNNFILKIYKVDHDRGES